MSVFSIVFTLTVINFIFQVDFVILMPLGQNVMDHFNISISEYSSVVGIYPLASGVMSLLFSFFGGAFRKKTAMLVSIFFLGISCVATGMVTNYSQLFFVRLFAGCWGGILNPLIFAIAADSIPVESRGRSMGWIMSGFSLASVIGVPLGLFLASNHGFEMPFKVFGAGFLLIFLMAAFLLPSQDFSSNHHPIKELLEDFKDSLYMIEYLQGYFLLFFISGAIFIIVPLISPYAIKNLGMNNKDLQQMYFYGGLLTVFTSRGLGVLCDKQGLKKTLNFVALISLIPVCVFVTLKALSSFVFIILGAVMMSFMSGMMVPSMTMASLIPEPKHRSAFNGILNSTRNLSSSIFAYLSGLVVYIGPTGKTFSNFSSLGFGYFLMICYVLTTSYLISVAKNK